ncbi:MAG: hypothetical protein PHF84_11260 [bacterium]|nr:hypothetical protein [bacterium]
MLFFSVDLFSSQIVLDNFDDGNSLTLYGKGDIGITSDKELAIPGNSIIIKKFDPLNDHTTGSGNSLKLENYVVDSYAGIYFDVTADPVENPYIDGSVYREFAFYLKSSTATTDWKMEMKDWDDNKVAVSLGNIPVVWTRFVFPLPESTNICRHINITNIRTIVLINKVNSSAGSLWIDDMLFDDFLFQDETQSGSHSKVVLSDQKIYKNNQVIRIKIIPFQESVITIQVQNADGRKISSLPVSSSYYPAAQEQVFEWDGKNTHGSLLRNGIYFLTIKIKSRNKEEKVVKPIGIFQ